MYKYCKVEVTKDQVDILRRSCVQGMLTNTQKMEEILLTHLSSSNYNLSEDKRYKKAYSEFVDNKIDLEYFNELIKGLE